MEKHNRKMKGRKALSMLLSLIMVFSVVTPAFSMLGITAGAVVNRDDVELAFNNIFVFEDWASNSLSSTVISQGDGTLDTDFENGSFRLTKTNMAAAEIYTAFSMGTESASQNQNYYSIPVEPGTTYTFSYNVEGNIWEFTPFVFMYDNQGLFDGLETMVSYGTPGYGNNSFEFTTPADVTSIQIRFTIGDDSTGRPDMQSVYADVKDIAIYKSELREIYNIFNLEEWANNPKSTTPGMGSGTIVPNVANGTIKLTTDAVAGNTFLTGFGIDANASNDAYYTMDVQPSTSYTLCYSIGDNNLPSPVHSQPYIVELDSSGKMITWYNYETPQLTGNKREFTTQAKTARIQVVFSAINDAQAISRYCTIYNIGVYKTEILNASFSEITGHVHRKAYKYQPGVTTYGELPVPSYVPEGQVFAGWYTGKNGTGECISADTEVSYSSYTVYPKFEPAVDSLTIVTPPTKTTYTLGEKVNTTGLVLKASRTYTVDITDENGNVTGTEQKTDTYDITSGYRFNPKTLTATGNQNITVEYGGKTASFQVNVSASNPKTLPVNGEEVAVTVANNEYTLNYHPSSPFNRYEMTYYSDSYVKGEIVMDGVTEEFFLEPSDNGSFASYIDSFLRGVTHYNVDSIKFTCLDKEFGNFELTSLTTINAPVPGDSTQYYQNDEYKVGISLDFGGVVSYIEDLKNKPVAAVYTENGKDITRVDYANKLPSGAKATSNSVNLINTNDRGRYLQQSYYGTDQPPYELGDYNGIPWNYNPVQGGNLKIQDQKTGNVIKGNESSKVIDYRITKDQIYVKTRPLDWGKNSVDYPNSYVTDSYMEAWYVFEDGMIKAYCRFVDYSGYPSNTTTQEYPALYTIEPLNNFVYHEGGEAWSNDNKAVDIDEPDFWGVLPEYNALLKENGKPEVDVDVDCNENWAAFTASPDDDSFGIGVYSAGITDFHYGVFPAIYNETEVKNGSLVENFRHTASLNPAIESPTSYISPVGTMTFESYKPSTYSFYITTGTAEQIRNDFSTIGDKESGEELAKAKIAVPETVYMTPANGASKIGQYYVNNIMNENDYYNLETVAERDDDMYFGIHVADADTFTVNVTNITKPSNEVFFCNTSGSEVSGSFKCDDTGTFKGDNQYGLRFSGDGLQPGEKATIKWEIIVRLKDGSTKTYTAYTVMYAPGRTVGAVAEARQVGASQNEISSWITGANGVDHSKRSPLGSFHGDKSASGYFRADPLYSNPPTGGSGETATDYIIEAAAYSENAYVLQTATNGHDGSRAQSYLGLLTVDKSRYTNTNQIPNLEIGYDALRIGSQYPKNSLENYTTYYTLGTSESFTSTDINATPSGWNTFSDYDQLVEVIGESNIPFRETIIPSYNVSEIDGKYIHALNRGEAYQTLVARRYSTAGTSVLCSVTDKSSLRDSVLTGYGITDTNPEFVEALEKAATVLGDPSATQERIDEARKELNDAMAEKVDVYYALKYDNLFSAYEFSKHPDSMTVVESRGTASYENGTITVKNDVITGGEAYTNYGSGNGYYLVDLAPNTEYIFEYDVTTTVESQAFMFFYKADGSNGDVPTNISVQTDRGSWNSKTESNSWWGNYQHSAGAKHYAIKFTTGPNTVKASFRFGNTSNDPTTSTFSNIRLVEANNYYADATYSKTEDIYKEYSSYGAMITPVRTGYTFSGWKDAAGNDVIAATIATEHKSVYSQWNESIYTVNYNKNGADEGSADAKIVSYTEQFTLPDNFSRDYYKFKGWAYTADAEAPVFEPGQTLSIKDIPAGYINSGNQVTLYAVWERCYSLYFSANNGTGEIPGSYKGYTEPHTIPENTTITREGYTFLGWSLDQNATKADYIAGNTIKVSEIDSGFIQTNANNEMEKFVVLHAVWQASATPSITFDNLIDMPAWEKLTANNAVAYDFTGTGFTLTSNVGAGEGTFESPYFDVEPGKQYKINMDFEGDGWDVYIFFCDANGNWIDFTDGGNRYSSNKSTAIPADNAIFTAPNKAEVVKAQIRVDANGSANTVKFNNIRVYEVGTVADGVSYETAKTVTYDTAYGELPVPTRYGYDFIGWVNAAGEPVNADTIMKSVKTVNLFSEWKIKDPQLVSDTVVIDFGLPVKINVLVNDINMSNGTLTAIGTGVQNGTVLNTTGYPASRLTGSADTLNLENGTVKIEDGRVIYTPASTNYVREEVFYYEYKAADNQFYYTTVTVIPATSVYFEDTMFKFTDSSVTKNGVTYNYNWQDVGTTIEGKFQSEDRPGTFTFAEADADNVYGTDSAYSNSATYSMGSAKYVDVDKNSMGYEPTAEFTFTGTGFDLFSVTDNKAGTIRVFVYKDTDGDGDVQDETAHYKNYLVNTYYGYEYDTESGEYILAGNDDAVFQVPVFRIRDIGYDTYKIVVKPMYSSGFDINKNGHYGIYVDSVRIFDPMGITPNETVTDAYKADGEYAPNYLELRDTIVGNEDWKGILSGVNSELDGSLFFDGSANNDSVDYAKVGPKNEVYLGKGQAIAFGISASSNLNISSLQIGMKLISNSGDATVTVMNAEQKKPSKITLTSATEQFYKLDSVVVWNQDKINAPGENSVYETEYPIIIQNTSDEDVVISLTSLKWGYTDDVATGVSSFNVFVDENIAAVAYAAIQRNMVPAVDPLDKENVVVEFPDKPYTEGDLAKIIVTTEQQITRVTVDGVDLTECEIDGNGKKCWTYTFNAERVGKNDFLIVVYDYEDNPSETIVAQTIILDKSEDNTEGDGVTDDGSEGETGDSDSSIIIGTDSFASNLLRMIFALIAKILSLFGGGLV